MIFKAAKNWQGYGYKELQCLCHKMLVHPTTISCGNEVMIILILNYIAIGTGRVYSFCVQA